LSLLKLNGNDMEEGVPTKEIKNSKIIEKIFMKT
jgi:hypothetical protein